MSNNIHVSLAKGGKTEKKWSVTLNTKFQKGFSTQAEAKAFATNLAKKEKAELSIHGLNGRIREKNSFGNDPRNIKG